MKIEPYKWSFHWHGRNKQGVSKWTGSITPLKWVGTIFSIYGPIAGMAGVFAFLYGLLTQQLSGPLMTIVGVGLAHGVVFTSIGQWALAMHRHIMRLQRADEVSAKLGIDEATLRGLAAQRNIQPRIILNDQPYYDPTEFVDALSLLRASSAQHAGPAALLRPVAGALESQSEDLLRADPGAQPSLPEDVQINVQNQGR